MGYSSIAQSGFMMIGIACMSPDGLHALMFYAVTLLLMNFVVFICLQHFEENGLSEIQDYSGQGKQNLFTSIAISIGLISLVGLPITGGFVAKIFVFSGIWESFQQTQKIPLLVAFIFGLVNTVVALFYYVKIPFILFVRDKTGRSIGKMALPQNLLALILVIGLLALFFAPSLLMGWIIRINFVL
jgi:NADH-quinone oxidoreductase subunit N